MSRRNCRFKSASLFRDSLNGQDTGSIEFKLFLDFSVCYTIKACIAECSYFDWSELCRKARECRFESCGTVSDFITLSIFNGRSAKKRVLRVVGSSPASLFENSSIWQSRASILCLPFLDFSAFYFYQGGLFNVKIQSNTIYQNSK